MCQELFFEWGVLQWKTGLLDKGGVLTQTTHSLGG